MIQLRTIWRWLAVLCVSLTLGQPVVVVADDDRADIAFAAVQDDDSANDESGSEVDSEPAENEEDNGAAPAQQPQDDDSGSDIEEPEPGPGFDNDQQDTGEESDFQDDGIEDDDLEDVDDDFEEDVAADRDTDHIEDDELDQPIQDEAIVQLRPNVDSYAFASRHGHTVLRVIPTPNIMLLGLRTVVDDDRELVELMRDDDVIWAEKNYTNQAPEAHPRYFFTSMASAPRIVGAAALPEGLEFTPDLACATGASVTVAVLDTGVDASHPALAGAILPNGVNMIANTYDLRDVGNNVDDDDDGTIDEMVGHGTHVTGIILQVAPDAQILPVKVLNSDGVGDTFSVTAGIYYAIEQGATVINLSLGTTFDSRAVETAADFAASEKVVVVAAAGNGDRKQPVEYPASVPSVISVASTTATATKADYSNFNTAVDISAPGNDIASAYPGGLYTTASGTSMSTPLVTGTVALVLEQQPDFGPKRVLALLQSTSTSLDLQGERLKGLLGAGELDIDASISCGG